MWGRVRTHHQTYAACRTHASAKGESRHRAWNLLAWREQGGMRKSTGKTILLTHNDGQSESL
jgi:hypothetical protein